MGIHIQIAEVEAEDNSYRYTGLDWDLTSKASSYDRVYDTSTYTNGLIKFYCSQGDDYSYIGANCNSSYESYYHVAYDTNIHYTTINEAIKKAKADGYLEEVVNNYVCFGSDEAICPNDNLYRIIGLFDDDQDGTYNAKLIKYDYANSDLLGTNGAYRGTCIDYQCTDFSYYKGNTNSSTIESYFWIDDLESNWTTSELNTINLNTNYINYLNNINSKWVDMIATTTWYLSGMNGDYTTKEFYGGERNNAGYGDISTTNGKIGLMYVSDYGYAANPENWLDTLRTYDGDLLNNWMYMGLNEWTIASMTMNIGLTQRPYIFYLTFNGGVFLVDIIEFVVRPTFYLKPEVRISGGTGTSSDPYRLEL